MKGWKAIIGIVLVFLLGMMGGALTMHMFEQKKIYNMMNGDPAATKEYVVTRLNRELNLDSAQLNKLRDIVHETHSEMREVRRQIKPQIEEVLKRSQDKVRAILRADQLAKFDKIVEARKKRHEAEENSK
ncbi:MAG TPA: hypothetical protein VK452_02065 [Dissulfurispiraceae bacterium]|nr:hypothetical protein [Dissulfurispiraceae bacterium]